MALLFQIEGAMRLDERVWKARLSPAEVRLLGPNAQVSGDTTVLLLDAGVKFDAARGHLAFDPATVKLLNAGTSDRAILISSPTSFSAEATDKEFPQSESRGGDANFLNSLPSHLRELGTLLLSAVRSKYPGELRFFEKSGRYVDTPDNFWTVKPQPRAGSFRITVRGVPDQFKDFKSLSLRPDQTGYSTFTIERASQIGLLVRLLGTVRRK